MAPNQGLVHLKEYDVKDSNVELIGSDIDHQVKFNSAATEPAWNDGRVGVEPGLFVWRIEQFEVVPWPREKYGQFYDGDSFIVLHSYRVGSKDEPDAQKRLGHDIFFWLGRHTTQDEAGTAAYKTVELDEFLHGRATQHRELQQSPSDEFIELFPRLQILSGGVRSGFRHVEQNDGWERKEFATLLRVFKLPGAGLGSHSVVVHEVEPSVASLDDEDVFILDGKGKIWVWQGRESSPMERLKAARVLQDMTLARDVQVEVLSQAEPRALIVVNILGGRSDDFPTSHSFHCARPVESVRAAMAGQQQQRRRPRRLYRLSDTSGSLQFTLVKDGEPISAGDLDGNDVFLLDDEGREIWVWVGQGASRAEKAAWFRVAQHYVRNVLCQDGHSDEAFLTPIAKVRQGDEGPAFSRLLQV